MYNVIVGRVDPRAGIFGIAISYLTRQYFRAPFLEYESALVTRDPLAADLVEPVSRY
ncbi:hypothetical protein ACQI5H_23110 [Mycobacterium heidelbergense]|uniref:hypothetical protein n=1 Tax=Mycobacterium heidelbergense TaxID=53376 RepID=UPI003CF11580